jgi:thiol:disulfide interchange protein
MRWSTTGFLAGCFLFLPCAQGAIRARSDDGPKVSQEKKSPDFYDEKADAKQLIADALTRAKKENRRVLLQWGGNWCVWCHRLHDLYASDKELSKELLYEYEIVYVDSAREGKNVELAASYGADLKKSGVPYLTVLDADGKVLANQETGALEKEIDGKKGHDPKLVLELLTKHQAPHLKADDLFDKALARAKAEDKRVFLHFGAPWCIWCKRLEAWMDRPEVEALLAKDFIDLKIDVDRTVGGNDLLKRYRPEAGGIPWFVLLDARGTNLADSGQGKQNIGFPGAPEEIDQFASMLDKARVRITPEDVDALKRSLVPPAKKSSG